jgi:hypothetical protein
LKNNPVFLARSGKIANACGFIRLFGQFSKIPEKSSYKSVGQILALPLEFSLLPEPILD